MGGKYVIMGVCGCGKSTVGAALATRIGVRFIDGDTLHPPANIAKMSAELPLEDKDRAPWLDQVGASLAASQGAVIVACSALKQGYRDMIRKGAGDAVTFLHLAGSRPVIEGRIALRTGHFMPTSLIDSQFAALEGFRADQQFVRVDIDQDLQAVVGAFERALIG
jgi:gluconokinase